MKQVLLADSRPNERFYVLDWLDRHPDVEFADELMEEAIRLYRADPSKWDYSSRGILSRLVAGRGNASHLAFFDELEKAGVGEGNERLYLENRLAKMKQKPPPGVPAPPETQPPSAQEKRQGKASGSEQSGERNVAVLWLGWAAVAVAAAGVIWFVLKGRAHGGDRKY
jgi:hypothetical protein